MKKDNRKYADRRRYLIAAVSKRRKEIRWKAVEYKGGKCMMCGYLRCAEALEFHHLEDSKKDFGISAKGYTRGWKRLKHELDKCILLCATENFTPELQLSRVIGIETSGEFREAWVPQMMEMVILSEVPRRECLP